MVSQIAPKKKSIFSSLILGFWPHKTYKRAAFHINPFQKTNHYSNILPKHPQNIFSAKNSLGLPERTEKKIDFSPLILGFRQNQTYQRVDFDINSFFELQKTNPCSTIPPKPPQKLCRLKTLRARWSHPKKINFFPLFLGFWPNQPWRRVAFHSNTFVELQKTSPCSNIPPEHPKIFAD